LTKEKIFEALQDVIQTLDTPNIKDPVIRLKWERKRQEIDEMINLLSPRDLRWMEDQYKRWRESSRTDENLS
jgi:hypothetical protein